MAIDINKKREEFRKDLQARRQWHKMMNYHYLMYKGISLLNSQYSQEVLESLGLQIHIPRTFMTIEAIRPDLDRPIDITAKWRNYTEKNSAEKAGQMLKGEWKRSKSDTQKAKAEFDALLFGSGYLLNYFELNEDYDETPNGIDKDGKPIYKKELIKKYEGMKVKWLNPYYVIPDRKARTYETGEHNSPRRIWVPSIWDYDVWVEHAKKMGYKTDGVVKGGECEEYDSVRRTIDALYARTITELKTRDNGILPSHQTELPSTEIDQDSIFVVKEYTAKEVNTYAGANFTLVDTTKYQLPKKEIPIYCLKDYDIPGELEGVGEAEVLRWQQYEENKVHNLMYLQVILNTVKRMGIVEELLVDPTDVRMSNPLKPIRLKYMAGIKVNDAVQVLNQGNVSDVPLNVLNEIKTIGQMATGQTDYAIGANKGDAGTLGEAEMMNQAGGKRVKQKIQQMEERGITPILESWLSAIPRLYSEELDYLLNDGTNKSVKFLPFDRRYNENAKVVSDYAVKYGAMSSKTLEEVFLSIGYSDVVFVSDLVGNYDLTIKTSLAFLDRSNMIRQYQQAIGVAMADNQAKIAMGQPPVWDTTKLTEEQLRQFSDIIDDISEYKLQGVQMPMQPAQPNQTQQVPPPEQLLT